MSENNNFRLNALLKVFLLIFIFIGVFLLYFNFFQARIVSSNSYNRRLRDTGTNVIRGSILDRKGRVLVKSSKYKNSVRRKYIYGRSFSHIIGYTSSKLGSSGIEAMYNKELTSTGSTLESLRSKVSGEYIKANNVVLTLDCDLQTYASDQLWGRKGSIVVLKPDTGEILAMVSKPDFNPSNIQENWESLISDTDSPLLNRAAEGLYPPGSIFKTVTAAYALRNGLINEEVSCKGSINISGYEIKDSGNKSHGPVKLKDAFADSCNSYFIKLGLHIGIEALNDQAQSFRFNKKIDSDLRTAVSKFPNSLLMGDKFLALQSIGQGDVTITPLHSALIAAAIANEGIMMQPGAIDSITDAQGKTLKRLKKKQIGRVIDTKTAQALNELMVEAVNSGTGARAKITNVKVAGKTGTAENNAGKPHSIFIGFAPADNPKVAIAVFIENGGSGGTVAAPIAGRVMKKALNLMK